MSPCSPLLQVRTIYGHVHAHRGQQKMVQALSRNYTMDLPGFIGNLKGLQWVPLQPSSS